MGELLRSRSRPDASLGVDGVATLRVVAFYFVTKPESGRRFPACPGPSKMSQAIAAAEPLPSAHASDPVAREPLQFLADPLADQTMAAVIGSWAWSATDASADDLVAAHAAHWRNIARANNLMATWTSNATIDSWSPATGVANDHVAEALTAYLAAAKAPPEWADAAKIDRAEELFMEYGALSCLLLFCASLPECYVLPDLAAVLHIAGQLEQHTEYRIRSTAAMIFPVMMRGGLTDADGAGVSQTLKVRLIHATIRNLILRGDPEQAVRALQSEVSLSALGDDVAAMGVIAPFAALQDSKNMHQALFAHGWKTGQDGLPCNQEELAYTLLTFSYVFLRALRTLGLGLKPADEDAYLHAWNVMAHVLGVRHELMPQSMTEAETMFRQMQARGRADITMPNGVDARPGLGRALMKSMEDVIPWRMVKPFPALFTRYLCGNEVAKEIGIDGRVSWFSRFLFAITVGVVRAIDATVRLFVPEFSISRFITRVVGYQFMAKFLMDQTRPLKLPDHLLGRVADMMNAWSDDPKAPDWMNRLEDRLTITGDWQAKVSSAGHATQRASGAQ